MTIEKLLELKRTIDDLRSWADNEEMIDSWYTDHGLDCKYAANELEKLYEKLADEISSNF